MLSGLPRGASPKSTTEGSLRGIQTGIEEGTLSRISEGALEIIRSSLSWRNVRKIFIISLLMRFSVQDFRKSSWRNFRIPRCVLDEVAGRILARNEHLSESWKKLVEEFWKELLQEFHKKECSGGWIIEVTPGRIRKRTSAQSQKKILKELLKDPVKELPEEITVRHFCRNFLRRNPGKNSSRNPRELQPASHK